IRITKITYLYNFCTIKFYINLITNQIMMKRFSLILLFLVIISCTKDDFSEHYNSLSKEKFEYKVSRIKWSDMQNNPNVMQKLNEINTLTERNHYLTGRGVYNETYGLVIDTTNIVMIERGDYHSYTFEIIRADEDKLKLENLVLSLEKENNYSTYIVTYHLKEHELE